MHRYSEKYRENGGIRVKYVEVKNEYKRYKMGETTITANDDISFQLKRRISDYTWP